MPNRGDVDAMHELDFNYDMIESTQDEQEIYQSGYRAGYSEGERDGYNRATAEMRAARESKVSKKQGQAPAEQGC